MKKYFSTCGAWIKVILLLSLLNFVSLSYALPFTIVPTAGTTLPTSMTEGTPVIASYTVTNNTATTRSNNHVKYLPLNVQLAPIVGQACSTQFTLAAGGSCNLKLQVTGAVDASDPDPHHHLFVCFPGDNTCAGTNFPLSVSMSSAPVQFTVTPSAGPNGTISLSTPQIVNSGANLTFTATPSSGYGVNQWLLDNSLAQPGGTSYTLTNITQDHTVQVTFALTTVPPTESPTVISTNPNNGAGGVSTYTLITANFSTAMNPATLNGTTFTVATGATSVQGSVLTSGSTATFTPLIALSPLTTYTATITTGAQDLSGNALATPKVWSFTTSLPTSLGTASTFAVLGGNAGIVNQGNQTVITGNIGTRAASTSVTGFHDAECGYTETPQNIGSVSGSINSAPPACGTVTKLGIATNALLDAQSAYTALSARPAGTDPGAGQLGGLSLAPGTYTAQAGSFTISGGNLILDAGGYANAIWVFQMATSLTVGGSGPAVSSIDLRNGAQAKNVYWQVGSTATINSAGGGTMQGTIIAQSGITFSGPGNSTQTTLIGRALSLSALVTMVNTTITVPT